MRPPLSPISGRKGLENGLLVAHGLTFTELQSAWSKIFAYRQRFTGESDRAPGGAVQPLFLQARYAPEKKEENRMSVIRLTIAAILMLCGTNAIAFGFVKDVPFEFPYIFELPGKSQAQIWEAARNHFASTYSDRRAVFSLEDQDQGLMIGKGVAPWRLAMNDCLTWYQIKFGAKDGRAKVQYIILEGVPPGSACTGWPRPNKKGYKKIREHIDTLAVELKSALEGNAAADEFMDF